MMVARGLIAPALMTDFLTAVWRSTWRDRAYAAINLMGLALGFACCLVLGLFVYRELTFDRHFDHDSGVHHSHQAGSLGSDV